MANPTTNYGWPMPTSADLVTDLPADFAAFGQPVDTSLKALNPETTLGDIAYRSATSNTNTRLAIGSTGNVLTVASGVPAWAAPSSGSMTLINSGGTTLTGSLITISSIPATYKDLRIEVKNYKPSADNELVRMRVNLDTTSTNYSAKQLGVYDNVEAWSAYGYSSWDITVAMDNGSTNEGYCIVYMYDYANTATFKIAQNSSISNDATNPTTAYGTDSKNLFYKSVGTAINSISFLPSSGTMTSGTVFVYGVN